MSWGYRHSTTSIARELQSNKKLINITPAGTKIYKSTFGKGILENFIIWKDNRKTKLPSVIIINNKVFKIDDLKTQNEIFKYAENKLNELRIISII